MRRFLLQYAAAMRLQQAGTHVIVYTDETFLRSRHCAKMLWYALKSAQRNRCRGDDDAGSRMDGERFLAWLEKRLLPAFAAVFPCQKMILVMDNASFHHQHSELHITPSAMSRAECVSFLEHIGDERFSTAQLYSRARAAPTKQQLQERVRELLRANPDLQPGDTKVAALMKRHGHMLVYTPPYTPAFQPIELLWAELKRQAGLYSALGRSETEARAQAEAFFRSVTDAHCQSLIRHAHGKMDEFIASEAAGDLRQFGSLDGLVSADPAVVAALAD
jgi:transposase